MGKVQVTQGRDFEYTAFLKDKDGQAVPIVGWTFIEVKKINADGSTLRLRAPLVAKVNEVQKIDFSVNPTGGTFKLDYGNGLVTQAINFNDDAATYQAKVNALSIFSGVIGAGVIDQATGLTTTYGGNDGGRDQPIPVVINNLVPVLDVTVTEVTKGIAETGVDVVSAERGELKIKGSEIESAALNAAIDQTVVFIVRIADKDLNIPPQESFLDVVIDPIP